MPADGAPTGPSTKRSKTTSITKRSGLGKQTQQQQAAQPHPPQGKMTESKPDPNKKGDKETSAPGKKHKKTKAEPGGMVCLCCTIL